MPAVSRSVSRGRLGAPADEDPRGGRRGARRGMPSAPSGGSGRCGTKGPRAPDGLFSNVGEDGPDGAPGGAQGAPRRLPGVWQRPGARSGSPPLTPPTGRPAAAFRPRRDPWALRSSRPTNRALARRRRLQRGGNEIASSHARVGRMGPMMAPAAPRGAAICARGARSAVSRPVGRPATIPRASPSDGAGPSPRSEASSGGRGGDAAAGMAEMVANVLRESGVRASGFHPEVRRPALALAGAPPRPRSRRAAVTLRALPRLAMVRSGP